jgi:DNA polymerase (family X)
LYSDCFEGRSGWNGDSEPDNNNQSGQDGQDDPCCKEPKDFATASRGKFTLAELTDLANSTGKDLVRPCDIRGILHSHSNYTDGAHSLAEMVEIAGEIGLEYLGISDHFKSEIHPCGLDLEAVRAQREEVDRLQAERPDLDVFQGVELDAHLDGTLPLDEKTLGIFDYVIVSFPETEDLTPDQRTTMVERVASHPQVTILGLPVGDWILRPNDGRLDMDRILTAAMAGRTAVEVNANPSSLPLDWSHCLKAQDMGVKMAISPNAHRAARLVDYRHGAEQAHGAGLCCGSFLNTLSSTQLREYLAGDS